LVRDLAIVGAYMLRPFFVSPWGKVN